MEWSPTHSPAAEGELCQDPIPLSEEWERIIPQILSLGPAQLQNFLVATGHAQL